MLVLHSHSTLTRRVSGPSARSSRIRPVRPRISSSSTALAVFCPFVQKRCGRGQGFELGFGESECIGNGIEIVQNRISLLQSVICLSLTHTPHSHAALAAPLPVRPPECPFIQNTSRSSFLRRIHWGFYIFFKFRSKWRSIDGNSEAKTA